MSVENNEFQNLIELKRAAKKTFDLFEAVNAPIVDDTIRYRKLSLNTRSGLLKYGQIQIQLMKSARAFPIIEALILNGGKDVEYVEFAKILKDSDNEFFRIKVRSTIKELRRQLKINCSKNKEDNIFIPTGKGYRLVS